MVFRSITSFATASAHGPAVRRGDAEGQGQEIRGLGSGAVDALLGIEMLRVEGGGDGIGQLPVLGPVGLLAQDARRTGEIFVDR